MVAAEFPPVEARAVRKTPAGGGVAVAVIARRDLPLVHLRWVIPGGRMISATAAGPRWPDGTLVLAADVASMGTARHPDTSFAAAIADLGATVEVSALGDAVVVDASGLSHQLPALVGLLRELIVEPQFDKAAIESARRRHASELEAESGDPSAIARRLSLQLAFGASHAYAVEAPTAESLGRITRRHVVEAWAAATRLGGSTLVAAGDVDAALIAQLVEREFGALFEVAPQTPTVALPTAATGDSCHVVQVDGAAQIAVHLTNPAPPRRTAGWPALAVANQLLGGSASARLFLELRERRGLTYGIYSGIDARRTAGRWLVQTSVRSDAIGEALVAVEDQLLGARRQAPTDKELGDARRYLGGQFALAVADGAALAEYLAAIAVYGLPADEFRGYGRALQEVGADQVVEATVKAVSAPAGRVAVLVGDVASARPAIDMACRRIVERDRTGAPIKVWIGTDAEMGDAGRAAAFAAWSRAPSGLVALGRFVGEKERAPTVRAEALAVAARGESSAKVLGLGRAANDWREVAPLLATRLVGALHDPDAAVQRRARALLLAMANDKGSDGKLRDLAAEDAHGARQAVAEWAFRDVDGTKTPDAVAALAEARLDDGDLAQLGDAIGEVLEHWIANNVRRHEAAQALLANGQPAALRALVRGYRRLLAYGVAPVDTDLKALALAPGIDALVLLLDVHALVQGSDLPHAVTRTAAMMATARGLIDVLAATRAETGEGSVLAAHYDRVEAHVENLLAFRNADDRWLAAGLAVRYRGVIGLRRALQGLADDDHYRAPRWHTTDPRRLAVLLARDDIRPLGAAAEPALLAALAAPKPIGKVVAVAGLKALGSDGAIAALTTCTDETEVSGYLRLPAPVTVRDLALAAVSVIRLHREIDQQVKAGKMSKESAALYKEAATFTTELADKRLREEVHRQVMAKAQALAGDATPVAP